MRAVSPAFDPYHDTRWCLFSAEFRLVDVDAAVLAVPSSNVSVALTKLEQTHDSIELLSGRWATLDTNGWMLDGTFEIMSDDLSAAQTGWWSPLSDSAGQFALEPLLRFDFPSPQTSIGFTVSFDQMAGTYPAECRIRVYGAGGTLISSNTFQVENAEQFFPVASQDYTAVEFAFTRTREPYQHVRVAEVVFGAIERYDNRNLVDASILYELSPSAEALPSRELSFSFENTSRRYNLVNPSGVYAYLQQGQPLDVKISIGPTKNTMEAVEMGRFYYTSASTERGAMVARITANDRLIQLDRSICRIGQTGTWTLTQAVAAILADSGLTVTTQIPGTLASRTIRRCIPQDTTHREALRMAAQAARCTCFFAPEGTLTFAEIVLGASVETVGHDVMEQPANVSVSERINTIELSTRDEYAETEELFTASDIKEDESIQVMSIDNPLAAAGDEVAAWLLGMYQRRVSYDFLERGNPARDVGDTITVQDVYGENRGANVIKMQLSFDGKLASQTQALGGAGL